MWTRTIIAALAASLIAGSAGAMTERAAAASGFARQFQDGHNRARTEAGVPPLGWSNKLAAEAQQWADQLAREGRLRHASRKEARGAGENLWMGSAGYYTPDHMIGAFVDEKRHFVRSVFPQVSRTGNWADVGHYTQVVWRDTREVGCAVSRGHGSDFLVCRYWPAGNYMGQMPF